MGSRLLVDRGGTFTDVVARDPDGTLQVRKLLSRDEDGETSVQRAVAAQQVDELRLGTTLATNALLERTGERVLLVTTKGFADLFAIGTQERPDLFALAIRKREPLHAAVAEIDERILADGTIRRAPDRRAVAAALAGWSSIAVVLLNAWVDPVHELLIEEVARDLGIPHVALSHRVSPGIGLLARLETTVADAYLTPLLRRALERLDVGPGRVLCMQSGGGLVDRAHFAGKDSLLSGPAGGAVATRHVAELLGCREIVGVDMGGTSTDVCRWGGEDDRVWETTIAGVRIRAPTLRIVTVAAGGGSILRLADGRFQVGPDSAGADPGPACYGRGGPATLTDANVVLGRIRPEFFPHLRLDGTASRQRLSAFGAPPEEAALGFLRVATEQVAAALREISIARGHDVRTHALCAFGGAAPQHACALARGLGIRRIVVHPLAGFLSAFGLGLADVSHHAVAAASDPRSDEPRFPDEAAAAPLAAQGHSDLLLVRSVDARYAGADTTLNVPWSSDWRDDFARRHERLFGFHREGWPVEIVSARVDAIARTARWSEPAEAAHAHEPRPHLAGSCPVYRRSELRPGAAFAGPALVVEDGCTTYLEEGWGARVDERRLLLLDERAPAAEAEARSQGARRDPVTLEVMSQRFQSIAAQMGEQLRRTAHSTNIKERLDFSCALFDEQGALVANAPHVPVHLGAMGETVRWILSRVELRPGDAWLSNDPYHGGSHLPDLTVVSPVFREGRVAFLVANRGHHADVGGSTPGSMPAASRTLAEEGVLFDDFLLLRDGRLSEGELRARLEAAGTRGIPERLADLSAQIAANVLGVRLLDELCARLGTDIVRTWMGHLRDNAAEVMRVVVAGLSEGAFVDELDDGSRIAVTITRRDGRARVDFTGTSGRHPGNRNAPRAVTVAATLYVFRTLAGRAIPLNAGCLDPIDLVIPAGSLLDPLPPAAVAGGNVETSQRIVDVLYGALGLLAASQGTMNNVTLGDEHSAYYETVCGGAGAGFGFDGASAVHTHMTNTRITDPEILESRHPVLVRRFAIRRGSGGRGVWRGGDGVVRELELLAPRTISVLAERRRTRPFGLRAGSGAPGIERTDARGLLLLTPGGGGYSPSAREWAEMAPTTARALFREGRWGGTTDGIASGFLQAWLVLVAAADAERAVAALRASGTLLHRSPPGELRWEDGQGSIDLATDLPLYVRRAAAPGPAAGAILVSGRPLAALGPALGHQVALLVAAPARAGPPRPEGTSCEDDLPGLPLAHWSGAPGRRLVTGLRSPRG